MSWFYWLFPLAFILHDSEELLRMNAWLQQHLPEVVMRTRRLSVVRRTLEQTSAHPRQFAFAVGMVVALGLAVTVWVWLAPNSATARMVYFIAFGAFSAHQFIHLGQALWMRSLTPGFPSLLVSIPLTLWEYGLLFSAGEIGWRTFWITLLAGVALIPLAVWAGHAGGAWLANRGKK